jgi:uncharacterized protein
MIRIVADTNIYISALIFGGNPEKIIKLAATEKIILLVSNAILDEVSLVLRKKFYWSNPQVSYADEFIRESSILVTPSSRVDLIIADEADNRILECAIEGKADYIVSDDRHHLLPLQTYNEIQILDAATFLGILPDQL